MFISSQHMYCQRMCHFAYRAKLFKQGGHYKTMASMSKYQSVI